MAMFKTTSIPKPKPAAPIVPKRHPVVPFTLSNLTNLEWLNLTENRLANDPTKYLYDKPVVQDYLSTL